MARDKAGVVEAVYEELSLLSYSLVLNFILKVA